MSDRLIIGIAGNAGGGKTTAAKHLVEKYGFKRYAFADEIKYMAGLYFNVTEEEAFTTKPPHVRTILQGIGSLVRKVAGPTYFIQHVCNSILLDNPQRVVIDDIRLPDEALAIKELGGLVIRLECPDRPALLSGAHTAHETETLIDDIPCDQVLSINFGQICTLRAVFSEIADRMIQS
jgi:hypothetical protein